MSYCPLTALPILFEGSRFLIKVLCGGLVFFFCKVEQMKCIWKRCRGELLLFVTCSGKHHGFLCAVKTVLCFWPQVSSFSESGWTSASQTAALSSTAAFWPVSPSVHLHPYYSRFAVLTLFFVVSSWVGPLVQRPSVEVDAVVCASSLALSSSARPWGAVVFAGSVTSPALVCALLARFRKFLWICLRLLEVIASPTLLLNNISSSPSLLCLFPC